MPIVELRRDKAPAAHPEAELLCRDCRWARPPMELAVPLLGWCLWNAAWRQSVCRHPSSRVLIEDRFGSPVVGRRVRRQRLFCSTARLDRTSGEGCGPAARYWQKRRASWRLVTFAYFAAGLAAFAAYIALVNMASRALWPR